VFTNYYVIEFIKYHYKRKRVMVLNIGARALGSTSEREYREKLNKINENLNKRARNIRKDFAQEFWF